MQKPAMDSVNGRKLTVVEFEIAQEQAESLGLAGKRLRAAIDRYDQAVRHKPTPADYEELLSEVVSRAWALVVQREHIGFRQDNLRWVRDHFGVPDAALRKLGHATQMQWDGAMRSET